MDGAPQKISPCPTGLIVEKCLGWANLALISVLKTCHAVARCFLVYPHVRLTPSSRGRYSSPLSPLNAKLRPEVSPVPGKLKRVGLGLGCASSDFKF